MSSIRLVRALALAIAAWALVASPALAQLISNSPWSPAPTNRAQIAFSLKSLSDGTASIGGGGTTIVCGGGGATAAANNTCIILNNSDGAVAADQTSTGDQNASTTDNSVSSIDEVSEILQ